jgi:hypothetical protein
MPNCPVCGRDVPAGVQYCPTCGTNLQPSYGTPATPAPTYSPNYSTSQGGMGMPAQNQPHGHAKYIVAIIVALLIGLVVGGVIGFSFPVAADFTTLNGSVTLNSQLSSTYHGNPNLIMFSSTTFGNLTSAVIAAKYLVDLPIGDTYSVSIQWSNSTGRFTCVPSTNSFSSNNQNAAQDFSC